MILNGAAMSEQRIGKAAKRERIIEAGLEVMYRQGYNGTGVKDIVDAAGIPKGSFYTYFESKEAFALEALDYFTYIGKPDRSNGMTDCLNDRKLSPLRRLDRLFSGMIDSFTHQTKFCRGCFIGNLSQEMSDTSEAIRQKAEALHVRGKQALQKCIIEAQEVGEVDPERDAETLAEFLWNSWEGAILRMKASKNATPLLAFKEMVFSVLLK